MTSLIHGFSVEEGDNVIFTEDQQHCICNIDEINFSLDASDGGKWQLTILSITVKFCNHPGTAQNKMDVSNTLMCLSNSAGEAMPLRIMLFLDATNEENYSVNAEWILNLPCIHIHFGHDNGVTFPATVAVNA